MPKFALIYRGGKPPTTPEEGAQHMASWRKWAEGLGDAYVYPGMPFASSVTVSATGTEPGSGDIPLSGVSVLEASDMATAQKMVADCPHLKIGGDIVVAEGMDLEM